ncbi:siderophore ABC transporter substrate-binding protein [Corynebacterium epidermidicanis]|uniref:ABC-type enterochelin transport system, periplasmic component n=1 Tax=Corynebacterium epidermidicanis TaxID=1050174 RepID=A0A0G3GMY4_9CORY|nr:ABC transporter substrate-binding protein [Corynebacterium epidermidicanis]AKK02591.1 ABC-type enterochelin transport system, periplasmic component [Corynebacterium epidermidicanis]
MKFQRFRVLSAATAVALTVGLVGCSSQTTADNSADKASTSAATSEVKIQDKRGEVTVKTPVKSAVVTDNRAFETLSAWGVELKAAPKPIIPETVSYRTDDKVVDLGMHTEPNLEAVVAANPDVVVNGQRFTKFYDEMKKLAPNATVVDSDPKDNEPLDAYLKRFTTNLGLIFGKEKEAEQLNGEFDQAIKEAKAAYKPGDKVLAVNVSGGKIGYIAPSKGRVLGPIYDMLGLTPALEVKDASDNHKGDEISVEAIADSNPDWILVMDRDAGTSARTKPEFKPAETVIKESEALKNVKAVQEGHVLYMPADTYTNDGIQTYTEFLKELAQAFKK